MLLNVDLNKLSGKERGVINTLLNSGKAEQTDYQSEFIKNEVEYRISNDSSGYTDEEKEEASKNFKKQLEENLDDFIDNEHLYTTWQKYLEKARESMWIEAL